jgi:hypothetical protein
MAWVIENDFELKQTLDSIALLESAMESVERDPRNDKATADFLNEGTRIQIAKLKAEVAAYRRKQRKAS